MDPPSLFGRYVTGCIGIGSILDGGDSDGLRADSTASLPHQTSRLLTAAIVSGVSRRERRRRITSRKRCEHRAHRNTVNAKCSLVTNRSATPASYLHPMLHPSSVLSLLRHFLVELETLCYSSFSLILVVSPCSSFARRDTLGTTEGDCHNGDSGGGLRSPTRPP